MFVTVKWKEIWATFVSKGVGVVMDVPRNGRVTMVIGFSMATYKKMREQH